MPNLKMTYDAYECTSASDNPGYFSDSVHCRVMQSLLQSTCTLSSVVTFI